jgi:hypothetical protein
MSNNSQIPSPGRRQRRTILAGAGAGVVVVVVLVLVLVFGPSSHPQTAPTTIPPSTLPNNTTDTFTVSGTQIFGPTHQPFVPYGIVVFGLSSPTWAAAVHGDLAKIHAIATAWHGNTVRLQVAPNYLAGVPHPQPFESALKKEVDYARSLHLVVIISAQTEHSGSIPMPTPVVEQFWRIVAPLFAHDSGVWFDLFNEPRLKGSNKGLWNIWQNGGDGYVGMQSLVDTIRAFATNIILAEGLHFARTLEGLQQHLLIGYNIVYEVHAFFVKPMHVTPAQWTADWGDLTSTIPMIVGAWSEYENGNGDCVNNAASLVPTFLSYVKAHGVGLIAWALSPGVLIKGTSYTDPTTIGANFVCTNQAEKTHPQGAGAAIMAFFAANSRSAPAVG